MPQFSYFGRDQALAAKTGVLESSDRTQVAMALMGRGITPVVIEPHNPPPEARDVLRSFFKNTQVDELEVLMFSRQMYTLAKAGVPIMRALDGLRESTAHAGMRILLGELRQALDAGYELSQAMSKHPDVFDRFYVSMMRVGETTGQLTEIFSSLYAHMDFQRYMREQITSALRYPKFVIFAMVGAVAVINIFVIPAFAKVFENLNAELPLMTRILLGTSRATVDYWPVFVGAIAALVFATKRFVATAKGRLFWDQWKMSLPVAGKLVRKGALSRACRSMALVLRSGVPLLEGLRLAAAVTENAFMERAILGMRDAVERGESVLAASRKAGIFTPIVLQMVMVGEESGTLDQMLDEIGQMYQREVEYELKTMSAQIEPILIFFLGAMVLVLALGVFMPMWDLGKASIK